MVRIKDAQIINLVEHIGEHYRTNLSNRFLRPVLLQLNIDKITWDQIESLTEKNDIRYQGFHLDELYLQIAACVKFVDIARNNMIPTLKNKLSTIPGNNDKIFRDMAANNFTPNLKVFEDLLIDLYKILTEIDKKEAGKNQPVYTQIPELNDIGRLLT